MIYIYRWYIYIWYILYPWPMPLLWSGISDCSELALLTFMSCTNHPLSHLPLLVALDAAELIGQDRTLPEFILDLGPSNPFDSESATFLAAIWEDKCPVWQICIQRHKHWESPTWRAATAADAAQADKPKQRSESRIAGWFTRHTLTGLHLESGNGAHRHNRTR